MLEAYQIIRRPIITEKGSTLKDEANQVVFEVSPNANKPQIKKAIEWLFKVSVLAVRTQNRQGKKKRVGKSVGKRKDWKKAIVTLKQGDRVEFFEGV
jgi:large subunit ribosomal protein L23